MACILLLSCNTTREPYPVFPLGLSLLHSSLTEHGHEVHIKDLLHEREGLEGIIRWVKEHTPEIIGLSIRNVDNVNYNKSETYLGAYKKVITGLRAVSEAKVVLGGSAFTILPEEYLQTLKPDYGIIGEGEESFVKLAGLIESGKSPEPGLIKAANYYPAEKIKRISGAKELHTFYLNQGGMLNIQTKRGCPHRCAYCSYPHLEGRSYRFRPASQVVDEIQMLIAEYKMDYFSITDSVFNDSQGHYLQIAEEIVSRGIKVPWMCFLRPQRFSESEVKLLKRSGLAAVEWGTDCSTDTTLKAMQKDFGWEDVVYANNLFARYEIPSSHFIIFGGPGETRQTVKEGINNIEQLKDCVVFASIGIRIFPDTAIYDLACREGLIGAEQNLLEPVYYFSKEISIERIHENLLAEFCGKIDRIYPDGMQLERIDAFHKLGYRGPVWDYILRKNKTRRRRKKR